MKDADYERELQKLYTMALEQENLPMGKQLLDELFAKGFAPPPIVVQENLR